MKKKLLSLALCAMPLLAMAQGWPANYGGVMLQGFKWDSFGDTRWTNLTKQAEEISQYFNLIWVPQSGWTGSTSSMGYDPLYYFDQHSAFGSEAELRTMISTFKGYGTGVIADVVVNHRKNVSNWVDFPKETYKGVTYQMVSTDICRNDDGGSTLTWATANGYSLSNNNDEGEDWGGMRDLDHKSANVQKSILAYVDFLINDLGYTGFRYDMVKGFNASHVADYNSSVNVPFSVGECWDSNSTITQWINNCQVGGTKWSAAFDFPFRYTVRDVVRGNDDSGNKKTWKDLAMGGVAAGANKRYAVTFVENHDTEYRSAGAQQDPIRKDTLAANAYLLTACGTPCVFLPHWKDYKQEIKGMIDVRKAVGVNNMSYTVKATNSTSYAFSCFRSTGTTTSQFMYCVVGDAPRVNNDTYVNGAFGSFLSDAVQVAKGYGYRLYMSKSNEKAWVDKASGKYDKAFDAILTAVSANTAARLVYTLDGSNPTASSKQVASGTKVTISEPCTLKVGLLVNGTVTDVQTRTYEFAGQGTSRFINVYVNVDQVSWNPVRYYTWDQDNVQHNGNWPGEQITETAEVGGKTWYVKKYELADEDCYMNFVFNTGTSGSPQTVDVTLASTDKYYEIVNEQEGGKYKVNDVSSQYSGIDDVVADRTAIAGVVNIYTMDGRIVRQGVDTREVNPTAGLPAGLYIVGGRKVLVK